MKKRENTGLGGSQIAENQSTGNQSTENQSTGKQSPGKQSPGKKKRAVTAAVAAALLAAVISAGVYIVNKDSLVLREPVRVSMMGENQDFSGKTTLRFEKDTKRVNLENGSRQVVLQSVPVYLKGEESAVLSTQMIYTNFENSVMRRVNYFARVEKEGQLLAISPDGRTQREVSGGYLHDGKNVYLFLEPVTVTWGEESLELAPLSYVAVFDRQGFYYYSYDGGAADYVSLDEEIVTAEGKGYSLNLSKDIVDLEDGKSLLLPPDPESFDLL